MKTNIQIFLLTAFLSLASLVDAREIGDGKDYPIAQQRAFLEEKVYAFCEAEKTVDSRGRKINNPTVNQSMQCLDARLALEAFNNRPRDEQFRSSEQQVSADNSSILKDKSIGRYVFGTFYGGLEKWVFGSHDQQGKFQVFADKLRPYVERTMVVMISVFALFAFFGKYQEYGVKILKSLISFVIVLAFLEWDTFNFWVFDPLLGLLIGTMKVLFDSPHNTGLVETIFGVDQHFDALFASIEAYDKLLEEKGAWYSFQIFKQIVTYLIIGLFAALYAIFTILIIVGFFGFMLLLGFAPIFMAIGIFNKGLFFAWLKATMNYFLIPIFTAAVMSVTIVFIGQAADAINGLSPSDSIFIRDVGFVFLVGIFSVGLHWKAPEFAAAISGGMASGAGSIVGTAASVGAAAWGLSKTPLGGGRNLTNAISGSTGSGMFGNQNTKSHQAGRLANAAWERLRTGGTK
jgi:type IV secretory pathway VirB6-like protein